MLKREQLKCTDSAGLQCRQNAHANARHPRGSMHRWHEESLVKTWDRCVTSLSAIVTHSSHTYTDDPVLRRDSNSRTAPNTPENHTACKGLAQSWGQVGMGLQLPRGLTAAQSSRAAAASAYAFCCCSGCRSAGCRWEVATGRLLRLHLPMFQNGHVGSRLCASAFP